MKHAQKMVMIPEHLLQSMETEHRLTAPTQLPTLIRLDQDMKQLVESPLPEDQKVLLLDQLLQRYQGLTKQMKNETTVKYTVVLPKPDPSPPTETPDKSEATKPETKSTKTTRKLPETPMAAKTSKLPRRITSPSVLSQEEMALPLLLETPLDSTRKKGRRKARSPMVARLRSNQHWEPY